MLVYLYIACLLSVNGPEVEISEILLEAGMNIILHSTFSLVGSGELFVPLGNQLDVMGDGAEGLMNFSHDLFLMEMYYTMPDKRFVAQFSFVPLCG